MNSEFLKLLTTHPSAILGVLAAMAKSQKVRGDVGGAMYNMADAISGSLPMGGMVMGGGKVGSAALKVKDKILKAIEKLQSGPGNYVAVEDLRKLVPEAADDAILSLAREEKLILGGYDGPRPIPKERAGGFVFDNINDENIYIAVAKPR